MDFLDLLTDLSPGERYRRKKASELESWQKLQENFPSVSPKEPSPADEEAFGRLQQGPKGYEPTSADVAAFGDLQKQLMAGPPSPAQAQVSALRAEIPGQTAPQPPPPPPPPPILPQPPPPIPVPQIPGAAPGGPRALPRATGGIQAPPGGAAAPGGPPAAPVDPAQARLDALRQQYEESIKPPDMAAAQEAYGKQSRAGEHQLVLAMLAQEAKLEPFAAHHLKQAAAAREPMKMEGGTMTQTGFIEDPGYKRQKEITRLQGQIAQEQEIIKSSAERADKIAAEKRLFAHQEKLQAKQQAATVEAARIAAGAKGGPGAASEGERKAGTLLRRLEFSQEQLKNVARENAAAGGRTGAAGGEPTYTVKAMQAIPRIGEDVANWQMTPEQRRVETAQLDMLDAALTLSTGAAYTREQLQGHRRSYFPQPGDDEATVKDKEARLNNVIEAAYTQAGRSAPARGEIAATVPTSGAAPSATPTRRSTDPLDASEQAELLRLRKALGAGG